MTGTKPPVGLAMMRAAILQGLDAAAVNAIVQGAEKNATEDLERQLMVELDRAQVHVQWVALVLVIDGLEHQYSYQGWTPPVCPEGAQTIHCQASLITEASDTQPKTGA